MKPVLNSRTTPYDMGEIIISKYQQGDRNPTRFKIIELKTCQSNFDPCRGCGTGNVAYRAKRFKKRVGTRIFSLCPMRNGTQEYIKWEPPVGEQL